MVTAPVLALLAPACSLLFDSDALTENRNAAAAGGGGVAGSVTGGFAGQGPDGSTGGAATGGTAGGAATGGTAGGAATGGTAGGAATGGTAGGAATGGTAGGAATGGTAGGAATGGTAGGAGSQTGDAGAPDGGGNVPPCSVGSEDFNDGTLHASISTTGAGSVAEAGGSLVLTIPSTQLGSAGIRSQSADLRNCRVTIEMVAPLLASGVTTVLEFGSEPYVKEAALRFNLTVSNFAWGGPSTKSLSYDPVKHRWWRISNAGGTTTFLTSLDGVNWTALGTVKTHNALQNGRVTVFTNSWQSPQAGQTTIDNFNL